MNANIMVHHALPEKQMRLKRLMYRAQYTGLKETDILLGNFARCELPFMGEGALDEFENLLTAGDVQILAWLKGDQPVPPAHAGEVFQRLKTLCHTPY